ncbi:MAG: FMN-binding protein [Firmicutes bacterium]|nr:FMN-binding protein [Bacillota bacterium]
MKLVLIILGVVVVLIGGFMLIFNAGMGEIKAMSIGQVDLSKIPDGVYRGSFKRGRWAYNVEVTVKDHKIEKVTLLDDKMRMFEKVNSELVSRILQRQTVRVDAVTGTTISSKALLKAVETALSSSPRG